MAQQSQQSFGNTMTQQSKFCKTFTEDYLYHNLGYDWDAELNELHGKDLWDTPNESSRKVRKMIVKECLRMKDKIKRLSFWRRLLIFIKCIKKFMAQQLQQSTDKFASNKLLIRMKKEIDSLEQKLYGAKRN